MIIRDKQDLRKCVKQCVRRAAAIETHADLQVLQGEFGVEAYLANWATRADTLQESFEQSCTGSPFEQKPFALLAALDALQLPAHNLDKAQSIIGGYQREAYLDAVLSAMRAKRVLVCVDADDTEYQPISDERFAPIVEVNNRYFEPGRYGVDYESAAGKIARAARALDTFDVSLMEFSEPALRYCMIPVCEDEHLVLHVHVKTQEQLNVLRSELELHHEVRAIVSADECMERQLVAQSVSLKNILVQLQHTQNIPYALRMLGTRFIPYASCAKSPEEMLGNWVYAKEALWQYLYDAYLPLARTGFELTRERIEADVETLLCGNYENLHRW